MAIVKRNIKQIEANPPRINRKLMMATGEAAIRRHALDVTGWLIVSDAFPASCRAEQRVFIPMNPGPSQLQPTRCSSAQITEVRRS